MALMDGDGHEMKTMVMVWTCDDDQALDLEKKKEKNKMGSRQRYI